MSESKLNAESAAHQSDAFDQRLKDTRKAGAWMLWTGLIIALLWWACSGYAAYAWIGSDGLQAMPAGLLMAASGLIILPGLILVFASALARQNRRTHEANLLLLSASETLLSPAKRAEKDIRSLAEATQYSSVMISQTSQDAMASLTAISKNMEEERLRAESVGYAMADNARDLSDRLSQERTALEALTRKLDEQSALISNAVPDQLAYVNTATARAKDSFEATDTLLRERIKELDYASAKLATQLLSLDHISNDAVLRTETLNTSINAIETRLAKTQKTIEMAERASSMAVDAASQTGQALTDAVSGALDKARAVNNEITDKTMLIQETSSRTMEELRKTGAAAASTAARVQEQSLGLLEEEHIAAPPAPEPPVASPPKIHLRDEADTKPAEFLAPIAARRPHRTRRVYTETIDPVSDTRPDAADNDLFDKADAAALEALELGSETSPVYLNKPAQAPSAPNNASSPQPASKPDASEWRDIIAEIDESDTAPAPTRQPELTQSAPAASRDVTAEQLMSRLQDSGIPLPTAFRTKDKKKIAAAARKNIDTRHQAIRNAAGKEVDRVAVRLHKDDQLMDLARRFVAAEETEALQALEATQNLGRHASPRLSTYLLIDAALAHGQRA